MCDYIPPIQSADSYNGASHDKFTWSQTLNDLEVFINIPQSLTSPRDLKVHVLMKEIKVETRKNIFSTCITADTNDWQTIFQGELSFPIKKHATIWSMIPSKYVHIYLEKMNKRWWKCLIIGETEIQLNKMDCSIDIDELEQCEQMKLHELMLQHYGKISTLNEQKK